MKPDKAELEIRAIEGFQNSKPRYKFKGNFWEFGRREQKAPEGFPKFLYICRCRERGQSRSPICKHPCVFIDCERTDFHWHSMSSDDFNRRFDPQRVDQ